MAAEARECEMRDSECVDLYDQLCHFTAGGPGGDTQRPSMQWDFAGGIRITAPAVLALVAGIPPDREAFLGF